jgi:CubicO group peptidase (beta-lactamase class C family)
MKRYALRNFNNAAIWVALFSFTILTSSIAGSELASDSLTEISSKLQSFVDSGETTGVVILAAHKGKIISHSAMGYQSVEAKIPMHKHSIFWAASTSKPFVAAAVMMLVEEGKLRLDDPVSKHIPEFKGMLMTVQDYGYASGEVKLVKPDRLLTIQDCLNHTHGLPATAGTEAAKSIKEQVMASARSTLDWEPGSKWRYGGEGLHVAAYLVKIYSGMSYADFLKKRIFDPLGMKDTYFMLKDVPKDRLVEHYRMDKGENEWKMDRFYDPVYFNPAGGLYSTAEDMSRFYQMMLNDGTYKGQRFLSKQSVKRLTTITCGHLEKGDHIPNCFSALGFRVVRKATDPRTTGLNPSAFGHGGSGGTLIWADPTNDTIYIFMRNNWGSSQTPMIESFQGIISALVK